jgi:uncharacterized phiE125 gp8 family phage protein
VNIVALTRTTAPTVEPVSLALAKQHLRVDHTDEDDLITEYIASARAWVESYLERSLLRQTWQMILDDFPAAGENIELRMPPAYDIVSFQYLDDDGDATTVPADDYDSLLAVDCGIITLATGQAWPVPGDYPGPVRISYRTGYGTAATDVPADLRKAVRILVEHQYRNRGAVAVGTITSQMPLSVMEDLAQYKVWRL